MQVLLWFLVAYVSSQDITPLQTNNAVQINGISGYVFHDTILIPRGTSTYGVELYNYNIKEKTFKLVADLNPGSRNSNPRNFITYNDQVFFIATTPDGEVLYKMNPSGNLVQACPPWSSQSSPEILAVYQNSLFFTMNHPDIGRELFKYYFDVQDWGIAFDIYPGPSDGLPRGAVVYNQLLFLSGNTPTFGRELFSFDGTNLTLVADIAPHGASSQPTQPVPFQGKLYFAASVGGTGADLWVYDGVTTVSAKDPLVQAFDSPSQLTVVGDYLYFVPTLGRNRLWRFDGSAYENVLEVSSIISGLKMLSSFEENLYFWSLNSSSTSIVEALWVFNKDRNLQQVTNRAAVGLFEDVAKSDQPPFLFQNNETFFFAFEDQMIWGSPFPAEPSIPTLSCTECQDLCVQSCKQTCKGNCYKKCQSNCQETVCNVFCQENL